jgi:hypothetical protein
VLSPHRSLRRRGDGSERPSAFRTSPHSNQLCGSSWITASVAVM